MYFQGGVLIFKLPYHLVCVYVIFVNPLVVQVWVPLPFDEVLQFVSSAEPPRVQNLLDFIFFFVIDQIWSWYGII